MCNCYIGIRLSVKDIRYLIETSLTKHVNTTFDVETVVSLTLAFDFISIHTIKNFKIHEAIHLFNLTAFYVGVTRDGRQKLSVQI